MRYLCAYKVCESAQQLAFSILIHDQDSAKQFISRCFNTVASNELRWVEQDIETGLAVSPREPFLFLPSTL